MKELSLKEVESASGASFDCAGAFAVGGAIIGGIAGAFEANPFTVLAGARAGGLVGGIVGSFAC